MKKLIYDTINFQLAIGESAFTQARDLRDGRCIGVKLIDFNPAQARAHAINVSVTDSGGTGLTGETDYRDYINPGGAYLDGFKAVNFDTLSQLVLAIKSSQAIAGAEFAGQVVFAIEVECQ